MLRLLLLPFLLIVLLLPFQSDQSVRRLQVHLIKVGLRQHFNLGRQLCFYFGDPAVTQLARPVLLVFPVGRRVESVQAGRLIVAITAEAVEPLPIFPARFQNEVIWIHTGRPVTEMRNLVLQRPTVLISFARGGQNRMKQFH